MTQLRRKLDEYFFGESISNVEACKYYGFYAVIALITICLVTL